MDNGKIAGWILSLTLVGLAIGYVVATGSVAASTSTDMPSEITQESMVRSSGRARGRPI